ncbi:hypothetical protein L195_g057794 [Trifolium pratense]|uniref:Uncharacterized protein n=1 Tax=Trifolium pratense TaxID=57577 RepID=A0A2K3KX30_TRIPR|nr:hypothetical protein L195_g057794 [Trifolium pratense]
MRMRTNIPPWAWNGGKIFLACTLGRETRKLPPHIPCPVDIPTAGAGTLAPGRSTVLE